MLLGRPRAAARRRRTGRVPSPRSSAVATGAGGGEAGELDGEHEDREPAADPGSLDGDDRGGRQGAHEVVRAASGRVVGRRRDCGPTLAAGVTGELGREAGDRTRLVTLEADRERRGDAGGALGNVGRIDAACLDRRCGLADPGNGVVPSGDVHGLGHRTHPEPFIRLGVDDCEQGHRVRYVTTAQLVNELVVQTAAGGVPRGALLTRTRYLADVHVIRLEVECDLNPRESSEDPARASFAVGEFLVMDNGDRVMLHNERGFTSRNSHGDYWRHRTAEEIVTSTLMTVLPDEDGTEPHPWEWLAELAGRRDIDVTADELRQLPYVVVLSDRVKRRIRDGPTTSATVENPG